MTASAEGALTPGEAQIVESYELLLAALRENRDTLPPFAERNAIKALAALWQVMNGLEREPGQLYDVGA